MTGAFKKSVISVPWYGIHEASLVNCFLVNASQGVNFIMLYKIGNSEANSRCTPVWRKRMESYTSWPLAWLSHQQDLLPQGGQDRQHILDYIWYCQDYHTHRLSYFCSLIKISAVKHIIPTVFDTSYPTVNLGSVSRLSYSEEITRENNNHRMYLSSKTTKHAFWQNCIKIVTTQNIATGYNYTL